MNAHSELFKPIAIQPPSKNRFLFTLRCLIDLQLLTIYRFLRTELFKCQENVLDVGAGQAPWRELFDEKVTYVGLDVETSWQFGMTPTPDVVYYDGSKMPFLDGMFYNVLCVEVLEHVPDAEYFISEIFRVLRSGGKLVMTIPWAARVHHHPHDYRRLSKYGLRLILKNAGFKSIDIQERGNDLATITNQLIVLMAGLIRPRNRYQAIFNWPIVFVLVPITSFFVVAAHISMRLRIETNDNPLGYAIKAVRP